MRISKMLGASAILGASILILSSSAFADTVTFDPLGFCPPPATVGTCTTATGIGGETIGVNGTDIGMMKNGNGGTASNPWFLLVAIPNYVGSAPTITFVGPAFTQVGTAVNVGQYLTSSPDLYTFTGTSGDNSMNAPNMFGPNEVAAFGSTPNYFEVFKYTFQPAIADNTPYEIHVAGAGLPNGTFLAGDGGDNPFTTPFTVTGLVNGPGCTDCGPQGGPVPEPSSLILLGTGLVGLTAWSRKRAAK